MKINNKRLDSRGIAHLGIVAVVIVGFVSFGAWRVINNDSGVNRADPVQSAASNVDKETIDEINSLIDEEVSFEATLDKQQTAELDAADKNFAASVDTIGGAYNEKDF